MKIFLLLSIILISLGCFYFQKEYEINPKPTITKIMESKGVDRDKCEEWLFGSDYDPFEPYLAWNKLHGDIFIVYGSDLRESTWVRWANECAKRKL